MESFPRPSGELRGTEGDRILNLSLFRGSLSRLSYSARWCRGSAVPAAATRRTRRPPGCSAEIISCASIEGPRRPWYCPSSRWEESDLRYRVPGAA